MDNYYSREKRYNILGIGLVMFFIFKGWELIFNLSQIFAILLIRVFFMRRKGKVQSVLLFLIIEKIIGLEEANNLKSIRLDYGSNDYKDEIERLRPDIELR